uniref:Protein PET100 homolog, mitochondrial n=1 Tax=Equus asinus TaxID=9793 RepID=A0A9L0IKQ7_EQUAS
MAVVLLEFTRSPRAHLSTPLDGKLLQAGTVSVTLSPAPVSMPDEKQALMNNLQNNRMNGKQKPVCLKEPFPTSCPLGDILHGASVPRNQFGQLLTWKPGPPASLTRRAYLEEAPVAPHSGLRERVRAQEAQMTLYLTFPVAMFWIANQAEWFEDYVIQRKRELWPPEKEDQRQELEEFKERIRKQREEKLLRAARQSS